MAGQWRDSGGTVAGQWRDTNLDHTSAKPQILFKL
jgi:hypothetical protein